jgi:hypothetical protein
MFETIVFIYGCSSYIAMDSGHMFDSSLTRLLNLLQTQVSELAGGEGGTYAQMITALN